MSEIPNDFVMAEDPNQSERLFRSMSHPELVSNLIAAQHLVAERIEEADEARRLGCEQNAKLVRLVGILRSAAGLKGRRGRMARDEALISAARVLELIVQEGHVRPGGIFREIGERKVPNHG